MTQQYFNKLNVDEISFTLSVKVRFFLVAFLIALASVLVYDKLDDDQRKVAEFGAAAFGVSLAGVSAIHAYRGIIYTQKVAEESKKIERTIDYISRWDDPDIAAKLIRIKQVLSEASTADVRISKYLKDKNKEQELQDIVGILNLLEKIAFFVYEGDIHKEKLAAYYRDIFYAFYDEFHQFIQDRREEKGQENLYSYFEVLHHEWHANGKK